MNKDDTVPTSRTIVHGIRLTAIRYPPFTERIRSKCPDGQLWLMIKGGWTTWIPKAPRRETHPFSLSFHPPGETNRQQVDTDGAALFSVQIPHGLLGEPSSFLNVPMESQQWERGLANFRFLRLFSAFLKQDQAAELMMEEELPRLLEAMSHRRTTDSPKREPGWVRVIIEILNDRSEEPLTLQTIATHAGVHPVHLATAFRQSMGCTIGEYLRRVRMEAAFRRLCATEDEISDIALSAGFYDQAHFSRLFKEHFKVPPGKFRRTIRRF